MLIDNNINTNIVIIGGGIAGLWLHHRLNDLGYHSVLIEKNKIGIGQTLSSQGIIHGGIKYSLNGFKSEAESAITDMPKIWQDSLHGHGHGQIDLTGTKVLTNNQLMWFTKGVSSKFVSYVSSKALSSKVQALEKKDHPDFFNSELFDSTLYQLNEPVLDIHSLLKNLIKKWQHRILVNSNTYKFSLDNEKNICSIDFEDGIKIKANQYVLAAGEGNKNLLDELNIKKPEMQCRPLNMVLAKSVKLPKIYAHCIGTSTKPIATITSHKHSDTETVWYIGGDIAEKGIEFESDKLIQSSKKTLKKILPWIDLDNIKWCTHKVNRAEPKQKKFLRPDTAFLHSEKNIHIAWPTKLALAPNLAERFIKQLKQMNLEKMNNDEENSVDKKLKELSQDNSIVVADTLWDRCFN